MKVNSGVFLRSDGKIVRITKPIEDPTKLSKRSKIRIKNQRNSFVKSKVKLPEVVSMWKNPHSELISMDRRLRQGKAKEISLNVDYFMELKRELDKVEKKRVVWNHTKINKIQNYDLDVSEISE